VDDSTIRSRGRLTRGSPVAHRAGGLDAAYLSGAAHVDSLLAADVGLFTAHRAGQQTAYLTRRVSIPIIVDAEPVRRAVNVERTWPSWKRPAPGDSA